MCSVDRMTYALWIFPGCSWLQRFPYRHTGRRWEWSMRQLVRQPGTAKRPGARGLLRRLTAGLAALVAVGGLAPADAAHAADGPRMDLKVLVLADGGGQTDAVAAQLDREGVPYVSVDLTAAGRQQITPDFLADAATHAGHFQAVVLTSPTDTWLSEAEKTALADYQRSYLVRQVDAYVWPGAAVGSAGPVYSGQLDGSTATVTDAGRDAAFGYLDGDITIDNGDPAQAEVWGYLAAPATAPPAGESFTPLVTASAGGASGSIIGVHTHDGGREELVISAAYNPYQQWFTVLGHGIVTWMTRGVHLGHHRNHFAVHIDDVLMADSRWSVAGRCTPGDDCADPTVTTQDIRMVSSDVDRLEAFQDANDGWAPDMVFNAAGSALAGGSSDPLTQALTAPATERRFTWINHTYTHTFLGCIQIVPTQIGGSWRCAVPGDTGPYMDTDVAGSQETTVDGVRWLSQAAIESEIQKNLDWEAAHPLTHFDPAALVTGEHSGLAVAPQQPRDNPLLGPALTARGITHIASDASREREPRTIGSAVAVPRHPMNIFYNAGTYLDEVSEYNWIYTSAADGGSGICTANPATSTCITPLPAATNTEAKASFENYVVPLETRIALGFILAGDPRPFYAHQSNLAEDGILYPVMQSILDRYDAMYDTTRSPLVRTDLAGQARALNRRTAWSANQDEVTAYVDASGVHVAGDAGIEVPVTVPAGSTGASSSLAAYGGELSGWIPVGGDAAVAVPPTPMGGYQPITAPPAPTAGAAAGDGSVTVSWTSSGDGGSEIQRWLVRAYEGTGATVLQTVEATGDARSVAVTGLTNGTGYSFDVTGVNAVGTGTPSGRTAVTVPVPPLGAPGLTGVTVEGTSATVTWTPPVSDGGRSITGYEVVVYSGTSDTVVRTLPAGASQTSLVVGDLAAGSYSVTVAAVAADGRGPASARSDTVTVVTVPGAPRITGAVPGNALVGLSWQAPAVDGGSPVTGYRITVYSGTGNTVVRSYVLAGTATSTNVTGLNNGSTYSLTVAAVNAVGAGAASARSATVVPRLLVFLPGRPSIRSVVPGNASVTVTWRAPLSDGGTPITSYRITVYSGTSSTVVRTATAPGTSTSLTVTGLTNGSAYTVRVAAVNVVGTGSASSRSSVVTPRAVPGAPTIGAVVPGNGSVTVNWAPPAPVEGVTILRYAVRTYFGSGGSPIQTTYVTAPANSLRVGGLFNGWPYSFDVAAVSAAGTGPYSQRSGVAYPRS